MDIKKEQISEEIRLLDNIFRDQCKGDVAAFIRKVAVIGVTSNNRIIDIAFKLREKISQSGKMLWVCGQVRRVYSEKLVVWDVHGIFDSEALAIGACKTREYFVGPVPMNEKLPVDGAQWPGVYFPKG